MLLYKKAAVLGNHVLGTFSYNNQRRLREFFPKIGKYLTPAINDEIVTYSNAWLKLWIERKFAIVLIPVLKSFISFGKDAKRYHKSFPKASKYIFTILYNLKWMPSYFDNSLFNLNWMHYCFNAFQYSGAIKTC